jgi:transposase
MMTSTTKRRFTDEFKREAVALWETSGRMQTEVAAELGIMPTMLRRWQRKLQDSNDMPVSPAAKPPVSAIGSPADQASEIARLRRELDRARMERDILTYGPPRPQGDLFRWQLTGLHQRIRHSGKAVAKMESRTTQAS